MRACLESALELIAPGAVAKGLQLICRIDEAVPPALVGDMFRLRQILLNLLNNAVKFTEAGEVVVEVRPDEELTATSAGAASDLWHFSIRDTGIGIPPDLQARLFQSFSQLDASINRRYGGTGLGLAISQRLAELMGGRLWVESSGEPGRGATFHFTLRAPAADDFDPEAPQTASGVPAELFDIRLAERQPLRILLAEDNAMNQLVALRVLERLGYQADVAGNGREALEAVRTKPYDVVLMDVQMPEMNGLEATRQIRAERPPESGPRIIAMTANAMQGDRETCLAAGMDDYVTKPFRLSELVEALNRCQPRAEAASPRPLQPKRPPQAATSLLDPAALHNLRLMADGDDTFVAKLIDIFFRTAGELFASLRQAVEQDDAAALCLAAHSLKSNSKSFGALALGELCRDLEAQGRAGQMDDAALKISQAESEYARVKLALEQEQRRLRPPGHWLYS